jgi:hypothetical protein
MLVLDLELDRMEKPWISRKVPWKSTSVYWIEMTMIASEEQSLTLSAEDFRPWLQYIKVGYSLQSSSHHLIILVDPASCSILSIVKIFSHLINIYQNTSLDRLYSNPQQSCPPKPPSPTKSASKTLPAPTSLPP